MIKKIVALILNYSLKPLYIMLKLFNAVVIFRFGNSLGDQVYMSSVLREINIKKKRISFYSQILINFTKITLE